MKQPESPPCPSCGMVHYSILYRAGEYWLKCRHCGRMTGKHETLAEAVAEWDEPNVRDNDGN